MRILKRIAIALMLALAALSAVGGAAWADGTTATDREIQAP